MAIIAAAGLVGDYKYYFFINTYPKPPEFGWQLVAFWWSLHGLLWVDRGLMATAGAVVLAAALGWRSAWGQDLWRNPLFGASLWTVAGSVLFMTLQDHPQPRYFAVPAFFCFFVVALGAAALLGQPGKPNKPDRPGWVRGLGWAVAVAALAAAGVDGAETIGYAAHPQYSWANAAAQLAFYIDAHPNGKRLLTSISGDQITLFTHLPSLCDDFAQPDLSSNLKRYQPGWYATWNDLDPGLAQRIAHRQLARAGGQLPRPGRSRPQRFGAVQAASAARREDAQRRRAESEDCPARRPDRHPDRIRARE